MNSIEKAVALIEDMQQKVDDGTIGLSSEEWQQLDSKLDEARRSLNAAEVTEGQLNDVVWVVIGAFEENQTLAEAFKEPLASLTRGTKVTGIPPSRGKARRLFLKNKTIILRDFATWVKGEADKRKPK